MKTYQGHKCQARHRTYKAMMKCVIPQAAWVAGEGPFALIAWCRVPTVTLYADLADAEAQKSQIDGIGCGGLCHRQHEIALVVKP